MVISTLVLDGWAVWYSRDLPGHLLCACCTKLWLSCCDEPIRQCVCRESGAPKRWGIPPDSRSPKIHVWCQFCHRNDADVLPFTLDMIEVNVQPSLPHKPSVKVKGFVIYIPPLTGKPEQQRFTTQSGVLTGNDTSGAAHVATAHCPNERTLDPTVCSYSV